MRDGWHTIYGREIYVEDNKVLRGVSYDGQRTTYPYRYTRKYGWVNAWGLTVNAFRAGVKRNTVEMY